MVGAPLVPPVGAPQPQSVLQRSQKLLLRLPMALTVPADAPYQLLQTILCQPQVSAHHPLCHGILMWELRQSQYIAT